MESCPQALATTRRTRRSVELLPFDITVGLSDTEIDVDVFALTDIVEDWLGAAFDTNSLGDEFA